MEYVNLNDDRVQRAIVFVEDEIAIWLKQQSCNFIKNKIEKIPWVFYIPASSVEEMREREVIIEKYGASNPTQIQYYLLYHGCELFAIFYWTVLRANGIHTKIVYQEKPFSHVYLQSYDGNIIDALLDYCDVSYPHKPERVFDTPYDFYREIFIDASNIADWEIKLLQQFKALE